MILHVEIHTNHWVSHGIKHHTRYDTSDTHTCRQPCTIFHNQKFKYVMVTQILCTGLSKLRIWHSWALLSCYELRTLLMTSKLSSLLIFFCLSYSHTILCLTFLLIMILMLMLCCILSSLFLFLALSFSLFLSLSIAFPVCLLPLNVVMCVCVCFLVYFLCVSLVLTSYHHSFSRWLLVNQNHWPQQCIRNRQR